LTHDRDLLNVSYLGWTGEAVRVTLERLRSPEIVMVATRSFPGLQFPGRNW